MKTKAFVLGVALVLCAALVRPVSARWGQGGSSGKENAKTVELLDVAVKELSEKAIQEGKDPNDLNEDELLRRVKKMKFEARKETQKARRATAEERSKSYLKSGRFVEHMALVVFILLMMFALYAFRDGIDGDKKRS